MKKSGKSLPRWRLRVYVETSTFFNRRPPSTTVQIRRIRPVSGCPVYMRRCQHLSTSLGLGASLAGHFLRGSSVVQSGFSRASLGLNRAKILLLRSCFVCRFLLGSLVLRRGVFPFASPVLRGQIQRAAVTAFLRPPPAFLMGGCPQKSPRKPAQESPRAAHNAPKTPRERLCCSGALVHQKANKTPHGRNTGLVRPCERFIRNTTKTPERNRGSYS